jgi:hypothetical protein
MIALDDDELAVVMNLAKPLPPDRRPAFLAAVIEEASKHAEGFEGLSRDRMLDRSITGFDP